MTLEGITDIGYVRILMIDGKVYYCVQDLWRCLRIQRKDWHGLNLGLQRKGVSIRHKHKDKELTFALSKHIAPIPIVRKRMRFLKIRFAGAKAIQLVQE